MSQSSLETIDLNDDNDYKYTGEIDSFQFKEVVCRHRNPRYIAPEILYTTSLVLSGNCHKHKSFKDGEFITTSPIKEIKDNVIYTNSGSSYKLMNPSKEYEEYCQSNHLKVFPDDKTF